MNYNIYPPSGIDTKIKIIQNALSTHLGFDGVDFYGRVQKTLSKDLKSIVPEFYFDFPKKREVFYDSKNAPGGNVFFIDADNHTSKNGNQFSSKVKIVFMLNLEIIFENKAYRADTEVQEHCLKLVKKIGALSSDLELEKGLENVLKGFDTKNIKLNDMQPYHIFSINGILNYTFNCNH